MSEILSALAEELRSMNSHRGRWEFIRRLPGDVILDLADELEPTQAPHRSMKDAIECLCWLGW